MTAMNEPRDDLEMDTAERPEASYETFMRVKSGISDGALRAAGLPPARELTYDAYLAAFHAPKTKAQDDLDRLRGERFAPATPKDEQPGPPPLGRRLVLAEAPDGTWRIVNDPDRPIYNPPPRRRYVAKTVAMLMGIAFAFVVAAVVSAVYLRQERAILGDASEAVPEISADGPSEAPAALQFDTASGGSAEAPAPPLPTRETKDAKDAATPQPEQQDAVQAVTAPAEPLPVETVATVPVTKPIAPKADMDAELPAAVAPTPRQVKPAELPKSTPTAKQLRLPSSTKPASAP